MRRGPPHVVLRVLVAPVLLLSTLVLFATGVALLVLGQTARDPGRPSQGKLHRLGRRRRPPCPGACPEAAARVAGKDSWPRAPRRTCHRRACLRRPARRSRLCRRRTGFRIAHQRMSASTSTRGILAGTTARLIPAIASDGDAIGLLMALGSPPRAFCFFEPTREFEHASEHTSQSPDGRGRSDRHSRPPFDPRGSRVRCLRRRARRRRGGRASPRAPARPDSDRPPPARARRRGGDPPNSERARGANRCAHRPRRGRTRSSARSRPAPSTTLRSRSARPGSSRRCGTSSRREGLRWNARPSMTTSAS